MDRAPDEEGQGTAVPEAADQKGDKQVETVADPPGAAAAQRDVNIVPKPSGEGDVPTAPKFLYGKGEVRTPKVCRQLHAEQSGTADGNVRIAGKVAVDLDGIHHGGDDKDQSHIAAAVVVHLVDGHGKGIRDHQFLKVSPSHLLQPVSCAVVVEAPFGF